MYDCLFTFNGDLNFLVILWSKCYKLIDYISCLFFVLDFHIVLCYLDLIRRYWLLSFIIIGRPSRLRAGGILSKW